MPAYVVQHSIVGLHAQGDVIEFTKKHEEQGVDVDRLLALGAIREADRDEAKRSVEYGTSPVETSLNFPPVPFESDVVREPVSPDPLRSENPPTLPEEGVKPETTQIKGRVSDKPKPARVEAE